MMADALLRDLGLNQLEAEIYLFLLPQPALTAYKIAKHLGKPAANVYSAVEVLARKGAVLLEDGDSRTCHAVPLQEFLARAESDFLASTRQAREQLAYLEAVPLEERVYRLETVAQVYQRCREMLDRAERIVVVDAFPLPLSIILPDIERAIGRGVQVHAEVYEPMELPGAQLTLAHMGDAPVHFWRSQQLNLVVDGRENLMALLNFSGDALLQAYWSNSLYLSCMHHGGRLCEQTLIRALSAAKAGATAAELLRILEQHPFFMNSQVPGQIELLRRYTRERNPQ